MARSSGQMRSWNTAIRDCDCGFHGLIEIESDPEVGEAYWDCPDCEHAGRDKERTEYL